MRHNPHSTIEYAIRIPLALFLLVGGIVFCYSGIIQFFRPCSLSYRVFALISLVYGLFAFGSFYYSVLNLAAFVHMDEDGMKLIRFGKTIVALPWASIVFSGPCYIDTYRGKQKRYCFANRTFSEEECKDISFADKECIYFSRLNQQELEYIRKRIPVCSDAESFLCR